MDGGVDEQKFTAVTMTEGEFAGWKLWRGWDPFEDANGPFYFFEEADGSVRRAAFRAEQKHMNGSGFMHGGCMMTFADFALFAIAQPALGGDRGVTATFSSELIGAGNVGDLVECDGEIVKAGKSLIFLRGLVRVGENPLMTFSGVIKKVGPRR
jgi:acyl-coenzyme A thioesterase PaaI-like protein